MNDPAAFLGGIATAPAGLGAAAAARAFPCLVCGEEVPLHLAGATGADVVCHSPACRMILARRAQVGPHSFRFLVDNHRRQRRDRQRLAERDAREAVENDAIRDAVDGRERLPASRFPLVVLPAAPQRLQKLPEERRESYREHLARIIGEAVAGAGDDGGAAPPAAEDPIPLARSLCALCGGGCCSLGHEKAYLDVATIRRVMRLRPELSPAQIAAEYLDRLAEETVAGSCVNHTVTGCGLPREMRSDTCNTYYCKSMRDWQDQCSSGDAPLGAFVIQRGHDPWSQQRADAAHDVVGVSLVSENGTRSV